MKVLVAFASRHGATEEIARELAGALAAEGVDAVALAIDDISDLNGYDAVVLGSAIYMGNWLERARSFASKHERELRSRPVWLFSSGPIGDPPKPAQESPDMAVIAGQVSARDARTFAGKLDKRQLSFAEKVVAGIVRAPEGDFRDWQEIKSWAAIIVEALKQEQPV